MWKQIENKLLQKKIEDQKNEIRATLRPRFTNPIISAIADSMQAQKALMLLSTAGQANLDVMLDPLPSLAHSGTPFATWLRFRAALLRTLLGHMHSLLASRSAPLTIYDARHAPRLVARVEVHRRRARLAGRLDQRLGAEVALGGGGGAQLDHRVGVAGVGRVSVRGGHHDHGLDAEPLAHVVAFAAHAPSVNVAVIVARAHAPPSTAQ